MKAMSRGPLAYRYDVVFGLVDMRGTGLRNSGDRGSRIRCHERGLNDEVLVDERRALPPGVLLREGMALASDSRVEIRGWGIEIRSCESPSG